MRVSIGARLMIVIAIGLLAYEELHATYPFVNDFHAFEYIPLWQSVNCRDIVVGDDDIVTAYWDININDSWRNTYHQIYYRRFSKTGDPLTDPILLTDSSRYAINNVFHVNRNLNGRSIITNHIRWSCPEWPNCFEQLMVWISNDEGDFVDTGFVVGQQITPEYYNHYSVGALDSSGNFVVCWVNFSGIGTLWCQLFNADKTPRTDTIRVAPRLLPSGAENDRPQSTKVFMWPNGDFIVAWQSNCPLCQIGSMGFHTMVRVFHADGSPKTEVICASCDGDSADYSQNGGYYPDLAASANGDFALTWFYWYASSSADCRSMVVLRRFFADGLPKGQQVLVDTGICDYNGVMIPKLTSDSAGNLVVVWGADKDSHTGFFNLMAQRFDPEGNRVGEKYRINDRYLSVYPISEPVAMNDKGLVGFFWDDVNGASLKDDKAYYPDVIQLMDLQDVGIYVPGDANNDHLVDISDAVYLISYIFAGGHASAVPCLGDVDGDDSVDISDVVALVSYIFSGGSIAGQCPE